MAYILGFVTMGELHDLERRGIGVEIDPPGAQYNVGLIRVRVYWDANLMQLVNALLSNKDIEHEPKES
jgi:hypothetical protein